MKSTHYLLLSIFLLIFSFSLSRLSFLVKENGEQKNILKTMEQRLQELRLSDVNYQILNQEKEKQDAESTRKNTPLSDRLMLPKTAVITAYTCNGLPSEEARLLNCPNGKTASGTHPQAFRTAACDRTLLGKKINILGLGDWMCEDRGGAINGNRIDIYLADYNDAISFGKRTLPVTIY